MADHVSAAKRARQSLKRAERNRKVRSSVKTAIKNAHEVGAQKDAKASAAALSEAFSAIQKSRGVFHRNTVKRKMARLAKAVAKKAQKA